MTPTGDNLTILLALATFAFTALVGALSTTGRSRIFLWIATVLLAALTAAAWITASKIDWRWVVPIAYATTPPFTIGIVAILLRRWRMEFAIETVSGPAPAQPAPTKPSSAKNEPEDAFRDKNKSSWSPNFTIEEAVQYLAGNRRWHPRSGYANREGALNALEEALSSGQLVAWGRLHPSSPEVQIRKSAWTYSTLDRSDGYAMLEGAGVAVIQLRLSREQVELTWPS